MWLVNLDLEPEFLGQLERSPDSVVVWAPSDWSKHSRLRLNRLTAFIQAHYRLDARFGRIEVWRRTEASR